MLSTKPTPAAIRPIAATTAAVEYVPGSAAPQKLFAVDEQTQIALNIGNRREAIPSIIPTMALVLPGDGGGGGP